MTRFLHINLILLGAIIFLAILGYFLLRSRARRSRKESDSPLWILAFIPVTIIGATLFLFFLVAPVRTTTIRQASLHVQVPDDFETWKGQLNQMDLDPGKDRKTPGWIRDAARSTFKVQSHNTRDLGFLMVQARFPSSHGGGLLPGFTDSPQPSPEAAVEQALKSAADNLRASLLFEVYQRGLLKEASGPEFNEFLKRLLTPEHLRKQELVLETHTFPLEHREPVMHHAATLILASPRVLQAQVRDARKRLREELATREVAVASHSGTSTHPAPVAFWSYHDHSLRGFLPVVQLFLIILLVGAFFKAGELSGWAWPVRVVSLLLLVALYMSLAANSGWLGP